MSMSRIFKIAEVAKITGQSANELEILPEEKLDFIIGVNKLAKETGLNAIVSISESGISVIEDNQEDVKNFIVRIKCKENGSELVTETAVEVTLSNMMQGYVEGLISPDWDVEVTECKKMS